MFLVSAVCLLWMHSVIQKMTAKKQPELTRQIEDADDETLGTVRA